MIYDSYFTEDYDESDIDPTCCDEVGCLETMLWVEEENRKLLESFINLDMKELIYKDNSDLLNEGAQEWIKDRATKFINFIKTIVSKIVSLIKAFIEKIKSFFSKKKDDAIDTNSPDNSITKQGNKQGNSTKQVAGGGVHASPAQKDKMPSNILNGRIGTYKEIIEKANIGTIELDNLKAIDYNKLDNFIHKLCSVLTDISSANVESAITMFDLINTNKDVNEDKLKKIFKDQDKLSRDIKSICRGMIDIKLPISMNANMAIDVLSGSYANRCDKLLKEVSDLNKSFIKDKDSVVNVTSKISNYRFNSDTNVINVLFSQFLKNSQTVYKNVLGAVNDTISMLTESIFNQEKAAKIYLQKANQLFS